MSRTNKQERYEQVRREVLECAPEFILGCGVDGPWMDRLSRHTDNSPQRLFAAFETKTKLVGFILSSHLDGAFEAVCLPADWQGAPIEVLRAMSLALIGYGADNLARHRVFLGEYDRRPERSRQQLSQQLLYLTNNFQMAMHAVLLRRRFSGLHEAASILLGQLLHAPLWWPSEQRGGATLDAWVCTQIGLLCGIKRPSHRGTPPATRRAATPAMAVPEPSEKNETWQPGDWTEKGAERAENAVRTVRALVEAGAQKTAGKQ